METAARSEGPGDEEADQRAGAGDDTASAPRAREREAGDSRGQGE